MGGQSAVAKADYIEREGKYERQDDELAHRESENMPEWAEERPALVLGSGGRCMSGSTGGFSAKWNLPCPGS